MAFEHAISKAIDMEITHDDANIPTLNIQFKYVRFALKLDDKIKTEMLTKLMGGTIETTKEQPKAVKLPRMYKDK